MDRVPALALTLLHADTLATLDHAKQIQSIGKDKKEIKLADLFDEEAKRRLTCCDSEDRAVLKSGQDLVLLERAYSLRGLGIGVAGTRPIGRDSNRPFLFKSY